MSSFTLLAILYVSSSVRLLFFVYYLYFECKRTSVCFVISLIPHFLLLLFNTKQIFAWRQHRQLWLERDIIGGCLCLCPVESKVWNTDRWFFFGVNTYLKATRFAYENIGRHWETQTKKHRTCARYNLNFPIISKGEILLRELGSTRTN